MATPEPDKSLQSPTRKLSRCPICREAVIEEYRPFCSKRCADIDLGRWLNGSYAIAGHHDDDEDGVPGPNTGYDADA